MKKTTFTLHDINKEMILSADSYLRTVIINKKRHYIRRIYNDSYFNSVGVTYFYIKGQHIPIRIPEIAEALSELPEIHLQILLQSEVLQITIEEIAKEFGISKRMVYRYKHNAIEELRRKLKDYEE